MFYGWAYKAKLQCDVKRLYLGSAEKQPIGYIDIDICMYIFCCIFIIWNWLSWFWMLKSLKIWSASWNPRRADAQSESKGLRIRWANSICFSLKAGRLKTQEELVFQLKSEGKENRCFSSEQPSRRSSLLLLEESSFLFSSGHQLIGWGEGNLLYSVYWFKC